MNKLFIPIIMLIAIATQAFAQKKLNCEKAGDKFYFVYSYDKAIEAYAKSKRLTISGQRNLAMSYHKVGKNAEAELQYISIISKPDANLAEDYYNYAMVLKSAAKYDSANIQLDKFNILKPADLRAQDYVLHKYDVASMLKDDGIYKVEHLNGNTDAEDFGPCYYKNKIVYTSSGADPKVTQKKSNLNGKPFLDLYVSDISGGQFTSVEKFDKSLDFKMNDGPASFNKEATFMAYTRNNYELTKREYIVKLEIYFRTYVNGNWSKPEPFALNNKLYSVGQPALSADGKTMYFTSDMPGGYGAADIYRISQVGKDIWGLPINLGAKINTEGDEMFPFYEENSKTLFFSSNGRYGLGGLDIYTCPIMENAIGNVRNVGAPLNSRYDDFSAIANDKMTTGLFASNRVGGSGDDDIYNIIIKNTNKQIQGIAKDKDGIGIPNTYITLLDDNGNLLDSSTTKEDASYSFTAATDKNFKLQGKKVNYIDGESAVSTFVKETNVTADIVLLQKIEPISIKEIVSNTPVGTDMALALELNTIYFDLDKFNIREDAAIQLDKMVIVMNDNPNMAIELGAYTDCRATKAYNQVLSDKRAKASASYLKKRIVNPSRIYGRGYGESKQLNGCNCEGTIVSDCTEEEFQKDRRTEFIRKINIKKGKMLGEK